MIKYFYILCVLLLLHVSTYAQQAGTGINTRNPDLYAFLHINETTSGIKSKSGLIITRYTTAERNTNFTGLTATDNGLLIFNITDNCYNYWNGATSAWVKMLTPFYFTPNCSAATVNPNPIGSNTVSGGVITIPITTVMSGSINAINETINGITFTMNQTNVTSSTTTMTINFSGTRTSVNNIYLPIRDNGGIIMCNVFVPVQ